MAPRFLVTPSGRAVLALACSARDNLSRWPSGPRQVAAATVMVPRCLVVIADGGRYDTTRNSMIHSQILRLLRRFVVCISAGLTVWTPGAPAADAPLAFPRIPPTEPAKAGATFEVRDGFRMELIAALLHGPEVLLLDEPTIGLDVVSQRRVQDFLRFYQAERKITVLLTSHYMKDVAALCKRVVIIAQGRIMYDGSLEGIIDRFSSHKVISLQFPADGALSIEYEEHAENPMPDLRECVAIAREGERKAAG